MKIEKNVPLPPRRKGLATVLAKMKVGDSFLHTEPYTQQLSINIGTQIRNYGLRHQMEFATRKDVAKNKLRVWRTA